MGLPMSWNSAARRTIRLGLARWTTAMVWARTSLWRWTGSCFEGQGGQLREELLGQPGVHEEPEPLRGVGHHQQLVELVPDALVGDDVQPAPQAGHRFDAVPARAVAHNRL